jgi:deoxyribodipyrimidine photolyase-related protein
VTSFRRRLAELEVGAEGRRWIFVPYDQLTSEIGPLSELDPSAAGIVLVESSWKAERRPYHKQKLALVLANLRHFALEQAVRGVAVRHVSSDRPYGATLADVASELGPLVLMEPAERELRRDVAALVDDGALELVPHAGWLTSQEQFEASSPNGPPYRMDAFYRRVRRDSGVLMVDGKPEGGKFSFDVENRKAWPGKPPAPEPPRFEPDEITAEVGDLVDRRFARHPGMLDLGAIPASEKDAARLWRWALEECLPQFGPYEDAMSVRSSGLFHTRISALLNLCRLLPDRVVDDAAAADAPLASREGFVRQVLGWREFVRHVHAATDGLRRLDQRQVASDDRPGDGGWSRWAGEAWAGSTSGSNAGGSEEGGARASFLRARWPLPSVFWGDRSGLECLDRVVADVWREGYSHHITRLMVLSNLATLLDVSPRELTDWFWVAYIDAYDWVVEPNVLGMGTFATGELMTTKPYVSGAAYIHRMSDFCGECQFDPASSCPITSLYWAFLERKKELLAGLLRMALPLRSLEKRPASTRRADRRTFDRVRRRLEAGRELTSIDVA